MGGAALKAAASSLAWPAVRRRGWRGWRRRTSALGEVDAEARGGLPPAPSAGRRRRCVAVRPAVVILSGGGPEPCRCLRGPAQQRGWCGGAAPGERGDDAAGGVEEEVGVTGTGRLRARCGTGWVQVNAPRQLQSLSIHRDWVLRIERGWFEAQDILDHGQDERIVGAGWM